MQAQLCTEVRWIEHRSRPYAEIRRTVGSLNIDGKFKPSSTLIFRYGRHEESKILSHSRVFYHAKRYSSNVCSTK
uniref:Uncharacterized protein n=1 Tax=Oryza sativa subsp. japonica TaxID=39947 RepID=Q53K26_ORYSJ|nr:hypothetical protein [Oryza sativa Japonica Group]ABF98603.1 hypothetical protein LOC_Os03g51264 [Oryza sativa Japonica Group]